MEGDDGRANALPGLSHPKGMRLRIACDGSFAASNGVASRGAHPRSTEAVRCNVSKGLQRGARAPGRAGIASHRPVGLAASRRSERDLREIIRPATDTSSSAGGATPASRASRADGSLEAGLPSIRVRRTATDLESMLSTPQGGSPRVAGEDIRVGAPGARVSAAEAPSSLLRATPSDLYPEAVARSLSYEATDRSASLNTIVRSAREVD
jgi:hypothetical protein